MGLHWDGTITLGNIFTLIVASIAILTFWSARRKAERAEVEYKKDIEWRIANLETWRREHMIDADARDKLLQKLDKVCDHLEYLVTERRRDNEGMRKPRPGQF